MSGCDGRTDGQTPRPWLKRATRSSIARKISARSLWSGEPACALAADVEAAGRAVKVTEAQGAEYMGIVILLVTLLPIVVLIVLDVVTMIKPGIKQRRHKRDKHSKRRRAKHPIL